jgi:hypothetical protein
MFKGFDHHTEIYIKEIICLSSTKRVIDMGQKRKANEFSIEVVDDLILLQIS